ncbi:MAG: 1-deoxy-D-xylulose-5-phosphate synthase [Propionibacteriaceae bacterium]|nr:1-deoxy-D-xylulose-5-phosphate synthase [Propionibacteriaceae bacterium]
MSLLEQIRQPADLRQLAPDELTALAAEIREFLIAHVGRTGGHLGSNLGIVELTIALHRVFDSPHDPIIFDTGHQAYVHKMLTGRSDDFDTLRQAGGLSGYPSRAESPHDWLENSHASAALSWAEGMAKAFRLRNQSNRTVVAVVGDGSLTGGMAWEALNNIAVEELPLVIVVNDNGRSYQPTVGGLAKQFSGLRTDPRYEQALGVFRSVLKKTPLLGEMAVDIFSALKAGLKDVLVPQSMFSDLGIKYIGPFNGHDIAATERALRQAKRFGGPVIVHAITRKGNGMGAAEHDQERFHAVDHLDEATGERLRGDDGMSWTQAFGEELLRLARQRPDVVALTAAMLHPTGLGPLAAEFPERVFDVGIAEQHAVAAAAGMAAAGLHPVVAIYATFLNRAFDQLVMDVGLHRAGVTFVLDRAGITGPDGASHHGQWDVALAGLVPGLKLAAPRDRTRLTQALETALETSDGPTVLRYSKGCLPPDCDAIAQVGPVDVLQRNDVQDVLMVAYGDMVPTACAAAQQLADQGICVTVVDPVWALPVANELVELAGQYRLVVTVEDDMVAGGLGSQLELAMDAAGLNVPVRQCGLPHAYIAAGTREEVLADVGLSPQGIVDTVTAAWATQGQ